MAIISQLHLFGKTCRKCGRTKSVAEFAKSRRSPDNREHNCRECRQPNKPPPIHFVRDGVEGKNCTVCKQWRTLADFHREPRMSDGLKTCCRDCSNAYSERYRRADPERWSTKQRETYQRHRAERIAKAKAHRDANAETVRAAARKRYPAKYAASKERYVFYAHTRRARKRKSEGQFTPAEWRALQAQYDNRCLRCGRTDVKLTPDHVIPLSVGGNNTIQNIQPLCLPCNRWKAAKTIDFRPVG